MRAYNSMLTVLKGESQGAIVSFISKIKILSVHFGATATVAAAVVAFSLPNSALAQEGAAGALLEEIVTTARKNSDAEAVQDVPLAVTAFGAAQIDALFVKKIDDLSYLMPNVQLEAVGTFPGVQNFSIRGQGINSSIRRLACSSMGFTWARRMASSSTRLTSSLSKCCGVRRACCLGAT